MIDQKVKTAIEQAWKDRAQAQDLKAGTKTYAKREVEFFAGAMAAINAQFPNDKPDQLSKAVPVAWVIRALSGRPIADDSPAK